MYNKEFFLDLKVLYVEDDVSTTECMSIILKNKFKSLYIANNGQDGLNYFLKYKPDIIITDINMPIMNGIEMVKEIKKIDSNVKIIYTSAYSEIDLILEAINAGIDEYIIKPINKTSLFFSIKKLANDIYKNNKIEEYNEFVRLILDTQDNLILVVSEEKIIDCNATILNFFGLKSLEELRNFIKYNYSFILSKDFLNRITNLKNDFKIKIKNFNNKNRTFIVNISPFLFKNNLPKYVMTLTDITQLQKQQQKLEYISNTDHLTKISNRNKFKVVLENQIKDYIKNKNIFSLIFFDIDHFKKINDTFGHNMGDIILKRIASLVKKNIRIQDTFARWGGEEFFIVCPDKDLKETAQIAEKLRKLINITNIDINQEISCSFSVVEMKIGLNYDKIIKIADDLLYKAKQNGRNRVCIE